MSTLLTDLRVQVFIGAVWTNIGQDILDELTFTFGIQGLLPIDCVASPGELNFTLDNSEDNSASVLGYYSPLHANKLTGWDFGLPVRVILSDGRSPSIVKWTGRIHAIDPEPGEYGGRLVHVTAYDAIYDLLDADVSTVSVAAGQTESQLIAAVLAAAPAASQPPAQSLDAGVDTIDYALYGISDSAKALPLINDICVASGGLAYVRGDGTFIFKNRHNRANTVSALTLTDDQFADVVIPSSVEHCWNRIHMTAPGILVSAPKLFYDTTDAGQGPVQIPEMNVGETVEAWIDLIGHLQDTALGVINVSIDSYSTIYFSDFAGTVPSFSVVGTFFATTAKLEITYDAAPFGLTPVWPVDLTLMLEGEVVETISPQVVKANVVKSYDRLFPIELIYDPGSDKTQGLVSFLVAQFAELADQIISVTFYAEKTATLLAAALDRTIGDRITISEAVTGVSTDAVIHHVTFSIIPGGVTGGPVTVTWGLAPAAPWAIWSLGEDGFSELGETTILGF